MTDFSYQNKEYNVLNNVPQNVGIITEVDRLKAAKQILLGIAVLYLATLVVFTIIPDKGASLLEIAKMVFPSLATLILSFYFKDSRPMS